MIEPDRGPREILLVEDEESHSELVLRAFEGCPDAFHLTVMDSVREAVAAIRKGTFDLVISDWFLPDGEALKLLEGIERFPLLVMTSHGSEQMAVEALKAGAMDYVVKSLQALSDMPHIAERAIRQWDDIVARERAENLIRSALREKEVLLKEVHHRVKNNMQVICSLLSLQLGRVSEPSVVHSLQEAYNRAIAMALVHEHLYQSESLSDVDFAKYIEDLAQRVFQAYCVDSRRIELTLKTEPVPLGMDDAIPCGLILNELVSNSLKHAFPGDRAGKLEISFKRKDGDRVELEIRDDGAGLPADFDIAKSTSLGLQVVVILTEQLGASLDIRSDKGACFRLTWQLR